MLFRIIYRIIIKESPSLRPYLSNIMDENYQEAVKQAKAETKLSLETFPLQCPYPLMSLLYDQFFE
ncbi:DUF29 family protein [Crocosphaera sp. Alani8]|uniref:DUF29 family protein n=1 Tax=Crocosphaera sp. Alani8 TaxID=3038952 RepID=UPI00313B1DDE